MSAGFKQLGAANGNYSLSVSALVAFPATNCAANDIAIAQLTFDFASALTLPAGWNIMYNIVQGVSQAIGAWYRMNGTENGTSATFLFGAGDTATGVSRMTTFSGAMANGVPFESSATANGLGTSANCSAITTLWYDRLGIHLTHFKRNVATTEPATWTETTDVGANASRVCIEVKTISSPSTEADTNRTFAICDWVTCSLAMLPINTIRSFTV